MHMPLMQVSWDVYQEIRPSMGKLIGCPAYYTINPESGVCIIWPTPSEGIKIIAEVDKIPPDSV